MENQKVHEGRNIKRIREMMGLKQEALAAELGEDWTQKKISVLEAREKVEEEILEQVAAALKIPADAIKNFTEEAAMYYIQNNHERAYEGATNFHAMSTTSQNHHCTFNAVDKFLEMVEENKKLYERLLQAEKEKVEMLERMLRGDR